MSNEWMLDVLADLRRFADLNDMPGLSGELARVARVAREEIRALTVEGAGGALLNEGDGRTLSGRVVAGEDA